MPSQQDASINQAEAAPTTSASTSSFDANQNNALSTLTSLSEEQKREDQPPMSSTGSATSLPDAEEAAPTALTANEEQATASVAEADEKLHQDQYAHGDSDLKTASSSAAPSSAILDSTSTDASSERPNDGGDKKIEPVQSLPSAADVMSTGSDEKIPVSTEAEIQSKAGLAFLPTQMPMDEKLPESTATTITTITQSVNSVSQSEMITTSLAPSNSLAATAPNSSSSPHISQMLPPTSAYQPNSVPLPPNSTGNASLGVASHDQHQLHQQQRHPMHMGGAYGGFPSGPNVGGRMVSPYPMGPGGHMRGPHPSQQHHQHPGMHPQILNQSTRMPGAGPQAMGPHHNMPVTSGYGPPGTYPGHPHHPGAHPGQHPMMQQSHHHGGPNAMHMQQHHPGMGGPRMSMGTPGMPDGHFQQPQQQPEGVELTPTGKEKKKKQSKKKKDKIQAQNEETMQGMGTPPPPAGSVGIQRPPTPLQQQHPYYGSMGPVSMAPGQIPMGPMGPGPQHMGATTMGPPPPHLMGGPSGPGSVGGTNGPLPGAQPNVMAGPLVGAPNNHMVNSGPMRMPESPAIGVSIPSHGEVPSPMVDGADISGQPLGCSNMTEGMALDSQPHILQRQLPGEAMPFIDPPEEKVEDGKKKKKKYNKKKKVDGGSGADVGAESGGADTADGTEGGFVEGEEKPKKKKYKKRKKEEPPPQPAMLLVKGEDGQEYVRMEVDGETILEPMGKELSFGAFQGFCNRGKN